MKKIILMRHGEAETNKKDWDRCLSQTGKEEVSSVASQIIKYKNFSPQYVICSEAQRTKETFEVFSSFHSVPPECCMFVESLYYGKISDVLNDMLKTPSEIENLMIIGHNPLITELASKLSGKPLRLGTSDAVLLESEVDWANILSNPWTCKTLISPSKKS